MSNSSHASKKKPLRRGEPRKAKADHDYGVLSGVKPKSKNGRQPLGNKDLNEDIISVYQSDNDEFREEESSAGSGASNSSREHVETSQSSQSEDEEARLQEAEQECKRLAKLEKDSKQRVQQLEKKVQQKSKEDKRKKRRKSREYQARQERRERLRRLEAENEARLRKIEELNRMEDHLSEVVAENSDMEQPKSSGECRELLNRLVSFHKPQPGKTRTGVIDIAETVAKMAGIHPTKPGEFKCDPFAENNTLSSIGARSHASTSGSRVSVRKRSRSPVIATSDTEDEKEARDTRRVQRKGKKLQSGKTAKFDDTDIKRVVKYPHSKLNQEFTSAQTYDELTINLFVAGELELIKRSTDHEHSARIALLIMIMYHSQYAKLELIKEQYDTILKRIEREEIDWEDNIDQLFDKAMERRHRMGVIQEAQNKNDKSVDKLEKSSKNKSKNVQGGKSKAGNDDTYYCLDYNRGTCNEPAAHKGKLGTREVLKTTHLPQMLARKGYKSRPP